MATNDFIGFASSGNANVMSQADYAAAHEQLVGVQPGMASSAMANKVWRQGANMASVIGQLIKNHGIDALDNGDLATLYNALLSATASTMLAGLMSAADKTKLDGLISTIATQSAAGYMSAADKQRIDRVFTSDSVVDVEMEQTTATGQCSYKKIGTWTIVSVVFQTARNLPIYSGYRLATGLPPHAMMPGSYSGSYFPMAMIFFDSTTYYGAWLSVDSSGVLYIYSRATAIPENLTGYCYLLYPYTPV